MSATHAERVAAVVRGVRMLSPTAFHVAGQRFDASPPAVPAAEPPVVPVLRDALYRFAYVQPFTGAPPPPPAPPRADDDLLPALVAANPGRARWEEGWEIAQTLPSGQVVARRHGTSRFLWPGEFVTLDGPGVPPRVGMRASLYRPAEARWLQPGFYYAFGDAGGDGGADRHVVRLYWSVTPEGAPTLLSRLVARLNRYGIPFRFKVLTHRSLFPRSDAAVLYVSRRYYRLSAGLALEVRGEMGGGVGDDVPLFTRRLAPGVGLAEDPQTGESFGMARCRTLAEGLWSAHGRGLADDGARMAEVAAHFGRAGIDLEHPYLNPGSPHRYEVPGHDA